MAKASVELKCSKCSTIYTASKKCYNRKEADSWEAWVSNQSDHICPECYGKMVKAQREAERITETAKNAEAIAKCTLSLPELVGSEKQVKWALDIRTRLIAKLTLQGIKWDKLTARDFPPEHKEKLEAELLKLLEPSAKAWIDIRGKTIFGVYVDL